VPKQPSHHTKTSSEKNAAFQAPTSRKVKIVKPVHGKGFIPLPSLSKHQNVGTFWEGAELILAASTTRSACGAKDVAAA